MIHVNKHLIVAGINYRRTALEVRSRFALSASQLREVYTLFSDRKHHDFFVLSTCNRTEVYALAQSADEILSLFALLTGTNMQEVKNHAYVKKQDEAMHHLYRVAAGLDSQILGDYEITGQLKSAFSLAKTHQLTSGYLEKIVNGALQASRQVRTQTSISDGTTSVAYAVIQLLKKHYPPDHALNICIIGTGKFGERILKNLQHYLPHHRISIVNRTAERAHQITERHQVKTHTLDRLQEVLNQSDILVTATAASEPLITFEQINHSPVQMVFDLSVPCNTAILSKQTGNVRYFDVDSLSQLINETFSQRYTQIPFALEIIDRHIQEFREWEYRRSVYASVLN